MLRNHEYAAGRRHARVCRPEASTVTGKPVRPRTPEGPGPNRWIDIYIYIYGGAPFLYVTNEVPNLNGVQVLITTHENTWRPHDIPYTYHVYTMFMLYAFHTYTSLLSLIYQYYHQFINIIIILSILSLFDHYYHYSKKLILTLGPRF